jgi:hypothetical protein
MRIQNVNGLIRLGDGEPATEYDLTPSPFAPEGTFRIKATFENAGKATICNLFFQTAELSNNNQLQAIFWNEPSGQQIQGFDQSILGHRPFHLEAGSSADVGFTIGLVSKNYKFLLPLCLFDVLQEIQVVETQAKRFGHARMQALRNHSHHRHVDNQHSGHRQVQSASRREQLQSVG